MGQFTFDELATDDWFVVYFITALKAVDFFSNLITIFYFIPYFDKFWIQHKNIILMTNHKEL